MIRLNAPTGINKSNEQASLHATCTSLMCLRPCKRCMTFSAELAVAVLSFGITFVWSRKTNSLCKSPCDQRHCMQLPNLPGFSQTFARKQSYKPQYQGSVDAGFQRMSLDGPSEPERHDAAPVPPPSVQHMSAVHRSDWRHFPPEGSPVSVCCSLKIS